MPGAGRAYLSDAVLHRCDRALRARGLDIGVLPYLDFPAGGSYQDPGFLEYPVVTGAFITALSAISDSAADFLRVNAALLGAVALLSAAVLRWLAGWLVMRWAAAPILALYAFNNWDLLAVGCVVAGCFMQARWRAGWGRALVRLGDGSQALPSLLSRATPRGAVWGRE